VIFCEQNEITKYIQGILRNGIWIDWFQNKSNTIVKMIMFLRDIPTHLFQFPNGDCGDSHGTTHCIQSWLTDSKCSPENNNTTIIPGFAKINDGPVRCRVKSLSFSRMYRVSE
jgi:hypothetical protein